MKASGGIETLPICFIFFFPSRISSSNNQPTGSAFVLLGAYRPWIDQTMARDLVDGQLVQWISAVPEPAALALWAPGLGAGAGRFGGAVTQEDLRAARW